MTFLHFLTNVVLPLSLIFNIIWLVRRSKKDPILKVLQPKFIAHNKFSLRKVNIDKISTGSGKVFNRILKEGEDIFMIGGGGGGKASSKVLKKEESILYKQPASQEEADLVYWGFKVAKGPNEHSFSVVENGKVVAHYWYKSGWWNLIGRPEKGYGVKNILKILKGHDGTR